MRLEQHDIVTLDEAESVDSLTKKLGDLLVNQKLRLTTAESCTGGKLASALCAAEFPSATVAILATFFTRFRCTLWVVFKVPTAMLAAFTTCF